jgi:hypothetical protein
LSEYVTTPVILTIGTLFLTFIVVIIAILSLIETHKLKTMKYVIDKANVNVVGAPFGTPRISRKTGSITSMEVKKSLLGRIMDYGTIELQFFGGGKIELENIRYPEKVLTEIQTFLEE